MNDATQSAPNGRVLLEMRDDVAVMTLNDPSVLNAFGFKLRNDMSWALDQLEASGARCLYEYEVRCFRASAAPPC